MWHFQHLISFSSTVFLDTFDALLLVLQANGVPLVPAFKCEQCPIQSNNKGYFSRHI